jgi:6-phosphofructokinase 1
MKKRIGILTGGGDCPGLNAVIRAAVWRAASYGDNIIGLKNGWAGLLTGDAIALDRASVAGLLYRGGTILGTSRTNLFKEPQAAAKAIANIKKLGLDAIIAVGGEDTLGAAAKLSQRNVPVVGVPKTIDNDLPCTDFTFGFDTAISIATEAIDRIHTTAESHNRVLVVEVMGRHAGWIAAYAGLAGGADIILVPEYPFTIEEVCEAIRRRHDAGKFFSIVCVAEGAQMITKKGKEVILASRTKDAFGHVRLGGIGAVLAEKIEAVTGYETRVTVLGHIQRGGSPTAHDRVLATRYGIEAMDCVNEGDFGKMVALSGTDIVRVPLKNITKKIKTINKDFYELTKVFQY